MHSQKAKIIKARSWWKFQWTNVFLAQDEIGEAKQNYFEANKSDEVKNQFFWVLIKVVGIKPIKDHIGQKWLSWDKL